MSLIAQMVLPFAVALLTLAAGYGLNSFPAIKRLERKWGALIRTTLWLTLGTKALEIWMDAEADASVRQAMPFVLVGLGVALAYEACGVWMALRRDAKGSDVAEEPQTVKEKVIQDVRYRVAERLDYAVGERSLGYEALARVSMDAVFEKVGSEARGDLMRKVEEVPEASEVPEMPKAPAGLLRFGQQFLRFVRREATVEETEEQTEARTEELNVTDILMAFNHEVVNRRLLILGEPGAGKTTALLTLADKLLEQAEGTGQFPYIFELSAWKNETQDLLTWMTKQIQFDFSVSPKVSREWIVKRQLTPLLDGLDELDLKALPKCVEQINEFASKPGQAVVVCCRSEEYAQGAAKLEALTGALRLAPLSGEQVRQYLEQIERQDVWQQLMSVSDLRDELLKPTEEIEKRNSEQEVFFLRKPLFLKLLTAVEELGEKTVSKTSLLEAYVSQQLGERGREQARQMVKSKGMKWAYGKRENEPSEVDTKRYLIWLATKLKKENITNNFLIEQMQPIWLDTKRQQWLYRFIVGLIEGLIEGLILGLIGGLKTDFQTRETPNQGIFASAKNAVLFTILGYPAGVMLWFLPRFSARLEVTWQESLLVGIPMSALLGFCLNGGVGVVQHVVLRIFLYCQGHIPWNYARFLAYTTERRLTQQIGGRFRFIHRELLDHFAAIDIKESQSNSN